MSVQFISKGVEWTEAMKDCVRHRIADPLRKHIPHEKFDIFVHLATREKRSDTSAPRLWMWIELKPPEGESFEMVLREGEDFYHLTNDVSSNIRSQLKKKNLRRRLFN